VTFYNDVRVPATMLVGELNGGWQLITEQLNHERVGLAALAYGAQGCFDDTLAWARATQGASGRVIDTPWVQGAFAECYALLQAYAMLGNRVAWEVAQGKRVPSWRARARYSAPRAISACCDSCLR